MGDAKRRGTREERVAKAIERIERLRPAAIVCNGCQAELRDVSPVPFVPIAGLDAVYVARCEACDAETLSAEGTPEALRALSEYMRTKTAPGDLVGANYARRSAP